MSSEIQGATGHYVVDGIPNGVSSVTPYIAAPDVPAAVAFYETVFRARTIATTERDGVTIHAHLDLGNGRLHLEAADPAAGLVLAPSDGSATVAFAFACPDIDDTLERALRAGATLRSPAINFASGDRFASILDPSGIRWSIVTRMEDLSEEESARRVSEWASQG